MRRFRCAAASQGTFRLSCVCSGSGLRRRHLDPEPAAEIALGEARGSVGRIAPREGAAGRGRDVPRAAVALQARGREPDRGDRAESPGVVGEVDRLVRALVGGEVGPDVPRVPIFALEVPAGAFAEDLIRARTAEILGD